MQAIQILNLLLPNTGGQASPNSLLGLGDGNTNAFAPLLEGEGLGGLETDIDLANSLNPEGGIVPVPVVSDTAPLPGSGKEVLLAYIQQREGRVSGDVLSEVAKRFGGNGLPQGVVGDQAEQLPNAALPNEVDNDPDFELLDNKKPDVVILDKKAGSELPVDNRFNQEIRKKINELSKSSKEAIAEPSNAVVEEVLPEADADSEGDFLKTDTTNKNPNAPVLNNLNQQVKDEVAKFKNEAIDADENVIQNTRFKEFNTSRLESQIRIHDQVQVNQTPTEQVKVSINKAVTTGTKEIQINLHPAELGKLDVEMELSEDGDTKVRIVADRGETLDLLRRDSGELRNALKDLGLKTDSEGLEFSLREGGSEGQEFGDSGSNGQDQDDDYLDLKPINEYQKYGNLNNQELILNISQEGLDIVA